MKEQEKLYSPKTIILRVVEIVISVCLILFWMFQSFRLTMGTDIWFDELFTLEFAKMPVSQMLSFAARDVHPPLYYLFVKLISQVLRIVSTDLPWEICIKLASVAISWCLVWSFCGRLHEDVNGIAGIIAIISVLYMPQLTGSFLEARMYGFGAFFVVGMLFAGKDILKNLYAGSGKAGWANWLSFYLFGMGAAYSQYFATICAAILYLFLLGGILNAEKVRVRSLADGKEINGKETEIGEKGKLPGSIKTWSFFVLLSVLAYLPWLSAFLGQLDSVSGGYWIQPLTIRSIGGCIKYLFKPSFENETLNVILAVLLFLIYAAVICLGFWKAKGEKRWLIMAGVGTLVLMVAAGFLLSILIRPIFVYRYMLVAMPAMWISFAFSVGVLTDGWFAGSIVKKSIGGFLILLLFCLIVPIAVRDYHLTVWEEEKKQTEIENARYVLDAVPADTVLICNFNQVQAVLWNYLPDNTSYLWGYTEETLIAEICDKAPIQMLDDPEQVRKLLESGQNVLFVGSGNARDEICALWEDAGIHSRLKVDSVLVERYWFNLYELSLEE